MPNCIIAGCTSKKNKLCATKGVILHVFPPKLDRIKTWLQQTGQNFGNLDEFAQKVLDGKRTDAYRLCSNHFAPDCYLERASKKALRVDAVPTIFHKVDATIVRSAKKRKMTTLGNDHEQTSRKRKDASIQTQPCFGIKMLEFTQWKASFQVVTDSQRIDKIRKTFTKRILDLAMEIINLMTGEDYAVTKKTSGDIVTPNSYVSEGLRKTHFPVMETTPSSSSPERNYKKILEVTQKMIELLTGEVPIRCQDVSVYFSMEEWEYFEGHKDINMDEQHCQMTTQSQPNELQTIEEAEEPQVKDNELCKEKEILAKISTDLKDTKCSQRDMKIKKEERHAMIKEEEVPVEISPYHGDTHRNIKAEDENEKHKGNKNGDLSFDISPDTQTSKDIKANEKEKGHLRIKEETSPEISTDPGDSRATKRDVKTEEEEGCVNIKEGKIPPEISTDPVDCSSDMKIEDNEGRIKEEEIPPEISPAGKYNSNMILYSNGNESDDEITDDSSDGNPVAPGTKPQVPPDPPTRGTSDHSYPIPHSGDGEKVQSPENGSHTYMCSLCGRSFSDKSFLRQHEKTHKGEMPYFCVECGKDYLHKSKFISHRRMHTGEKPYSCNQCGKGFAYKHDLVRHHRTHTGEKPFSCSDCGKRFTQRVHLITHQKKHAVQKL